MRTAGIVLVCFGILVLVAPWIINYVVAVVLIMVGANLLFLSGLFGGSNGPAGSGEPMRFGGYEIYRNKKK